MLALGCIGTSEMIIASFFWQKIMNNQNLTLLHPGELVAQLSALGNLIGIVGVILFLFRVVINFFQKKKKIGWLLTGLFFLFIVEFFWVAFLYMGV